MCHLEWLDLSGAPVDRGDTSQLAALAKGEIAAGRRTSTASSAEPSTCWVASAQGPSTPRGTT
jgi:hypothetical protein